MFSSSTSTFKLLKSLSKTAKNDEKTSAALTLNESFVFFDIGFSPDQIDTLSKLKITKDNNFESIDGNFENILENIKQFIDSLDEGNAQISLKIAELILAIINSVISEMRQESAWVVMRASTPHDSLGDYNSFRKPRWHTDGPYFQSYDNESKQFKSADEKSEQFKAVFALKGLGTLFYNLPENQREAFYSLDEDRDKTEVMINNELKKENAKKIESPSFGQGAAFIAGSKARAAVHSEPPHIKSERFFIAIAPCSRVQLAARKELMERLANDPGVLAQIKKAMEMKKISGPKM